MCLKPRNGLADVLHIPSSILRRKRDFGRNANPAAFGIEHTDQDGDPRKTVGRCLTRSDDLDARRFSGGKDGYLLPCPLVSEWIGSDDREAVLVRLQSHGDVLKQLHTAIAVDDLGTDL